jgi:CHAT domain-containing protein
LRQSTGDCYTGSEAVKIICGDPQLSSISGLAQAFFYAGARSLFVSNWAVDSKSAVALMTGAFAALAVNPKLSHAEAPTEIRVKRTNTRAHNSNADEMALQRNSIPCPEMLHIFG